MSIILDALKKAQSSKETQGSSDSPATENKDPVPAPSSDSTSSQGSGIFNPTPSTPSGPQKPNKSRVILLAILAIAGLAAVVFYSYGPQLFSSTPSEAPKIMPKVPLKKASQQDKKLDKAAKKTKREQEKVLKMKKEAADYFANKKFDRSMYVFRQLIDLNPTDPEAYNNYGLSLKKLEKYKEAKQAYFTALALNPDYAEALNNLAVIEMGERKYNDAKRRLEKAIQVKPEYLDPYLHLAICLEKTGDINTAVQYYKSFLDMSEGKISRKIRLQIENRLARLSEDIK